MGRYDLTDVQWERLKPLLPPEKPRTGRPNHDHRRIDWSLHFVDSTIVRAHQHAAGARKTAGDPGGRADEALGRSRGGFTTKIHIRAEGLGKPVTFSLTGGQVHDSQQFATLIGTGWIRRLGRGRPRLKPDRG